VQYRNSTFFEYSGESPEEAYVRNSARTVRTFDVVNPSPGGPNNPVTLTVRRQFVEDMVGANVVKTVTGPPLQRYISRLVPYFTPATQTNFLITSGAGSTIRDFIATAVPTSQLLHVKRNDTTQSAPAGTGVASGPVWRAKVYFDSINWGVQVDANVVATSPPSGGTASPILGLPDEGDMLRSGLPNTRYITRYTDYAGRLITTPAGFLYFADSPGPNRLPLKIGVPVPEGSAIVHYLWRQVPGAGVPVKAIQALLSGVVNECPFDGWPKGTLLLRSVKETPYQGRLGDTLYDLDYTFEFLAHQQRAAPKAFLGWNSGLMPGTSPGTTVPDFGTVDYLNDGTKNNPPFLYGDFCALFRPDQS